METQGNVRGETIKCPRCKRAVPAARNRAVPELDIPADDFTLCVWCKLDDIEKRYQARMGAGGDDAARTALESDRAFSKLYDGEFERLLTRLLECPVRVSTAYADMRKATDFTILEPTITPGPVAARVRRYRYVLKPGWAGQFTLRYWRKSGAPTEFGKIMQGFGRWLCYAFAAPEGIGFCAWVVVDLDVFREWCKREMAGERGRPPGVQHMNYDGKSSFMVFELADLPPGAVRARQEYGAPLAGKSP